MNKSIKLKRIFLITIRYIFTLFFLILVFLQLDIKESLIVLNKVNVLNILFIFLIANPLFHFIKIVKWKKLVNLVDKNNRFSTISLSFFFGFLMGIITPGRIGEFARIKNLKGDKFKLISLAFFDRFLDFAAVIILAFFSSVIFFSDFRVILLTSMVIFVVLCILIAQLVDIKRSIQKSKIIPSKVKDIFNIISLLDKRLLINLISMTFLAYIVIILQFLFIIRCFTDASYRILFIVPIVQISNIIPITIGGFGLREAIFLVLTRSFSISKEIIIDSSILWVTFNIVAGIIGYIVFYLKHYKELKHEKY